MEIDTSRFGRIEIQEDKIIVFQEGLVGFADQTRFILLQHAPESPFHWLQSVEHGNLAFPLADPDHFVEGYVVTPPPDLERNVGTFESEDLWLGAVVTFGQDRLGATLNLKAPVILNTRTQRGTQVVLEDPQAPIRFPIGQRE